MIYCEALLISILVFTLISAAYSDMKNGLIENKKIILSSSLCVVINVIYYSAFASDYLVLFIVNLLSMSLVAVILYAYHIWAAGDSKLLISVLLAIPGRFYFINYKGILPGFILLILIFGFAFIYVAGESVYLWIRNKDWKNRTVRILNVDWKNYLCTILSCMTLVFAFNGIAMYAFAEFFIENDILLLMITFILILTIMNYHWLRGIFVVIIGSITCALLIAFQIIPLAFGALDYRPYILLVGILAIRLIAGKYNYREIPTDQVKRGTILSFGTIAGFIGSRVNGLPVATTEDLRSRLTEEEAESVVRWKDSKFGKDTVVIVRKIPFAIYIALGAVVFLILEVM